MAAFGNTPLAKAVAFTPIVAGYVYYSNTYLKESWGFQNALWLYWSLISLSIGQWIYIWRAPVEIKRFRDNEAEYINQALTTWSERRFEQEATHYMQRKLAALEGTDLTLKPDGVKNALYFKGAIKRILPVPKQGHDPEAVTRWFLSSLTQDAPIRPNVEARRVNANKIKTALEALQNTPATKEQMSNIQLAERFMNQPKETTDWKKEVLEDLFKIAQHSKPLSRVFVCGLYLFGSAYFITNTVKTAWKMIVLTV